MVLKLKLAPESRKLLDRSQKELLLGIIQADGLVRLARADANRLPGHAEWLQSESTMDAWRGFSLFIKKGQVQALFPMSRVNPGVDAKLEKNLVNKLKQLLSLSESFEEFGS